MLVSAPRNSLPKERSPGKRRPRQRRERDMTTHHVLRGGQRSLGDDQSDVTQWRLRRLLDSGFPRQLASELATTPGVDLHALLDLVGDGCPPDLAARILAPLADTDPRM